MAPILSQYIKGSTGIDPDRFGRFDEYYSYIISGKKQRILKKSLKSIAKRGRRIIL
ncbi:hypothetical protein [Cardinium endosymbiont of Nabis limbatus]|uniref:hypothetical protein n=1 Tax=Cardinium endosymbiont of Nabis limbatus TaxID=3066217 RepID=UPI003AF3DD61